jgi:hypothetical protein
VTVAQVRVVMLGVLHQTIPHRDTEMAVVLAADAPPVRRPERNMLRLAHRRIVGILMVVSACVVAVVILLNREQPYDRGFGRLTSGRARGYPFGSSLPAVIGPVDDQR